MFKQIENRLSYKYCFFFQSQRTAKRGSGQISMKDINKLDEMIKKYGMQGKIKFMEEMDKNDPNDKK